ncbi:hypothetical protein SAMN05216238_107148 [Lentibacillus persicus]|uniref:Uncharacterized protein n=1 Tax=Lentibacillus persicus TaxID=640948 RepID=A0A1I1X8A3_9BACI|nr:hypothetical protein [Lentibacillus persicus]SFE03619.1 hypothetical protein SAMN05216238_107148 [Lentibacillus persicus]
MGMIGVLVLPFFVYALVMAFKFSRSNLSKDKKEQILAYSSKYALGVFPLGWLILQLYHDFIASIPYDIYMDAMWILVLLLFTIQGFAINYYKKQTEANQG